MPNAKPSPVEQIAERSAPALTLRAELRPGTVNLEARTVDLVWSAGARVLRGFWERFWEELSMDPKHIRMARLTSGRAPLLDSHSSYGGVGSILGVVQAARTDGKEGTATVRFPKEGISEEADKVFRLVQDGIVQNVSVGYRVHKFTQVEGGEDKIPVYRAVDWEPHEVSLVAIGADAAAGVRSSEAQGGEFNPCLLVRGVSPHEEIEHMERNEQTPAAPAAAQSNTTPAAPSQEALAAERAAGERAALERYEGIRKAVRAAKLGDDFADELIRTAGLTLDQARAKVIEKLAAAGDAVTTTGRGQVEVGRDIGRESLRSGMENALLHRADPDRHKLTDVGTQYRGFRLLELAREALEAAGVKTRGMVPNEVAGLALGLGSRNGGLMGHTSSDFPSILADVANKTLRPAYEEAPQTYKAISRQVTIPDFKPVTRAQLGEAPQLKKVLEGGEVTRGTIGEGKESYKLATYARAIGFTRQMLINDDMDAFTRLVMLFARSARDLESDLVWDQITSNPTMGDGVALFHATHGNLAAGAAISVTTVGAGRTAMRRQKGVDKKQFVNTQPKYLIVPAALETVADQFLSSAMLAATNAEKNPFTSKLTPLCEPRLDDTPTIGATAWYLAADPSQIDVVEYAYLVGETGPRTETRIGFDVDGLEIKCTHDFAAKVIDFRGLYRNG